MWGVWGGGGEGGGGGGGEGGGGGGGGGGWGEGSVRCTGRGGNELASSNLFRCKYFVISTLLHCFQCL